MSAYSKILINGSSLYSYFLVYTSSCLFENIYKREEFNIALLVAEMFVILLCAAVLVAMMYISHCFSYWKRLGLPEIPNKRFLVGHFSLSLAMTRSFGEICADLYAQIPPGNPLAGAYIFFQPAVVIKDPELLRCALVKDFSSFHDRGLYINEDVDPLSGHLFLLPGNRWKALRNKLSPTFTSGKMKMMFQVSFFIIRQFIFPTVYFNITIHSIPRHSMEHTCQMSR